MLTTRATAPGPNPNPGPSPRPRVRPGVTFARHSVPRSGAALPGSGSSLPRLLAERRSVRNVSDIPPLTEEQILAWADAHRARTGDCPHCKTGPILEAPGEQWRNVDLAWKRGGPWATRRLVALATPHGTALDPLGARRHTPLTIPRSSPGPMPIRPEPEIGLIASRAWIPRRAREKTRRQCERGPGARIAADSLGGSLGQRDSSPIGRGFPCNGADLPPLTIPGILPLASTCPSRSNRAMAPMHAWTGSLEAPGEEWRNVDAALREGLRGLRAGPSLPRLLAQERGARNEKDLPPFRIPEILQWADAYHTRHGTWPTHQAGPIPEAPGETWIRVQKALYDGLRGLPGGSSLTRLLAQQRGVERERPPCPRPRDRSSPGPMPIMPG